MGPRAREVLQSLTEHNMSNAAFPFGRINRITLAGAPVLALRVTYVGELGWELHIPVEFAASVYEVLMEAGKPHGIANAGYRAIDSLRMEKGYLYWSSDITPDYTPFGKITSGLDVVQNIAAGGVQGGGGDGAPVADIALNSVTTTKG